MSTSLRPESSGRPTCDRWSHTWDEDQIAAVVEGNGGRMGDVQACATATARRGKGPHKNLVKAGTTVESLPSGLWSL